MDILDDILSTIDLKGTLYFKTNFSGPWSVEVPDHQQAARFHLVVQGKSYFHIAPDHNIELNSGDLILIPHGTAHVIADKLTKSAPTLETVLKAVNYSGDGVLVVGDEQENHSTQMVCGHFNYREKSEHLFINSLPSYILVSSADRAQNPLLDEILRLISRRIFIESFGSDAAIKRLSELVFIELLRLGVGQQDELRPILEALKDPKIQRSLDLIHRDPARSWTLDTLASEVAMSRSRFAEHFKKLVGTSPMSYLAEWRLQKSLALIGDTQVPIQKIAAQTGYHSSSAFTRAFHDKFGMAPKEYRLENAL